MENHSLPLGIICGSFSEVEPDILGWWASPVDIFFLERGNTNKKRWLSKNYTLSLAQWKQSVLLATFIILDNFLQHQETQTLMEASAMVQLFGHCLWNEVTITMSACNRHHWRHPVQSTGSCTLFPMHSVGQGKFHASRLFQRHLQDWCSIYKGYRAPRKKSSKFKEWWLVVLLIPAYWEGQMINDSSP